MFFPQNAPGSGSVFDSGQLLDGFIWFDGLTANCGMSDDCVLLILLLVPPFGVAVGLLELYPCRTEHNEWSSAKERHG